MKHILVLYGGTSDERTVSLKSGNAVKEALDRLGYTTSSFDPQNGLDNLDAALEGVDLVFPMLHGEGGEDGTLQQILESKNIPFVGSGSAASALCFDKWEYKQHLRAHGFPTPNGELVTPETIWSSSLIHHPFVLKPNDGGSSIDTFIIRDPTSVDKQSINEALQRHNTMLLEELIEGIETTVAVVGDTTLPMVEIIPPKDQEFDYENKYNGASQELCPPVHVSASLQGQAAQLALDIHRSTDCRDLSRTDIMINSNDTLHVLETNTIPGMTIQSLVPKAAEAAGKSMDELIAMLVEQVSNH